MAKVLDEKRRAPIKCALDLTGSAFVLPLKALGVEQFHHDTLLFLPSTLPRRVKRAEHLVNRSKGAMHASLSHVIERHRDLTINYPLGCERNLILLDLG